LSAPAEENIAPEENTAAEEKMPDLIDDEEDTAEENTAADQGIFFAFTLLNLYNYLHKILLLII
jgi:hypothetical protein